MIQPTRLLRLTLALAVAPALFLATGCTQVQVGSNPNARGEYKLGELQVLVDHDFNTVYTAASRGIKDVGLFQTRDDRKVIEAELNGRDSTDTLVVVKIKEIGRNRTSIKIRYGIVSNDLASAQKLYQAIEKHF